MSKPILFGFFLFSLHLISDAQVASITPATLNMGGGSAVVNSDFILDWSIGESTVIETFYGQNLTSGAPFRIPWNVTSGILQPFDNTHIIYNYIFPSWTTQEIRLYPVPTPNTVFIDFRSVTTGKISIQLYSSDGKLLGGKEFYQLNGTSIQSWNLSNQASGIYYFRILLLSDAGVIVKQGTFKVEKNK